MRNIAMRLAYKGTHYLGWQETKEGPSIEGTLRAVLEQLLQHPVQLQAASRTDGGVHAAGQVVNCLTDNAFWETYRLHRALNGLLPHDISIYGVWEAAESFHPTIDVKSKEYHYFVCYGQVQLPHVRELSWHLHHPLDLEVMRRAGRMLSGKMDFRSFCNQRNQLHYSDYVRNVTRFELFPMDDERLRFEVAAPHFLYKMVRNLVGTVLDIGRGKIALTDLPSILADGDRRRAGVTAPAHGLILHRVFY